MKVRVLSPAPRGSNAPYGASEKRRSSRAVEILEDTLEVTTSIREEDGKTAVTVELAPEEVQKHVKDFFKELAKTRIPGFRPGKAPRKILEQNFGGHDAVFSEIATDMINDVAPKDRDIAMVFQSYALYPHMTVRDNMAFALKLRHMPKAEIEQKVRQAAEILDITQYLDRKPKALSGGQRQRVAIGRAIVRAPKVMLMDEPLSNLDAKLRNEMRAEIIKLRERIDTTFIYVTHDQTEAMTLGDRIVIMRDGYVQQIGTPQEVFNHPANLFVAGFIGMPVMNFFDAKLVKEGSKYFVEIANERVELDPEKEARLLANNVQSQDVTLGVRPEHTDLNEKGGITGKVDVAEMMGSSVHLHITAEGRDVIIIVPTVDMKGNFSMGDEVRFTFRGNVAHVFSKETDKNLEF